MSILYLQTSALPYIPLHANRQGDNPVMRHRHNTTHVVACISDYQGIVLVTTHESPNMTPPLSLRYEALLHGLHTDHLAELVMLGARE